MSSEKSELDTTLESMTNDELESVSAKISNIIRERDPATSTDTPLSRLVAAVQGSKTGTLEIGVVTPFKELVLLRVQLLDDIVRH